MIGQTISHYKIIEKLGGGGMGVVYKAEDTKLKRLVALKFLPPDLTRDEEAKERFVHEAQAASALDHPNICVIHEIDETEEGQIFICMAYYEGETLKKKVAGGQLSVDSAIDLAIQIAQGLARAHEAGITHRDIKPANLMITNRGEVKAVDFGLAKLVGQSRLTKAGMTVGTVAYMSPEQTRGEEVDHRADIWAWGVVCYEMITGQLPFRGEYEAAMIYSILNENPMPPKELRPDIPEELEQIVLRALEKDRQQRFQSIEDVLQHLKMLCGNVRDFGAKGMSLKTLWFTLKRPRIAITTLAILIVLAAAVIVPYQRLVKRQRAEAILPQIEKLAQSGKYFEAYQLVSEAEKRLQNDSTITRLMPVISNHLTVITQPEGASAYVTPYVPHDEGKFQERKPIGQTPIQNFRLPRADCKIDIEKQGFMPVERMASSELNRTKSTLGVAPEIHLDVRLFKKDEAPENMVFVPGGPYRMVGAGAPTTAEVVLDEYFIDKYEVSNAQYKTFILAGGYSGKRYWKHAFIKEGEEISWDEATRHFTDRAGLSGPRSWVNQEFPEGKDNHPVKDITWYEAAAYSEFAGKSLPTVFQWEKAARNGPTRAHMWSCLGGWSVTKGRRRFEPISVAEVRNRYRISRLASVLTALTTWREMSKSGAEMP